MRDTKIYGLMKKVVGTKEVLTEAKADKDWERFASKIDAQINKEIDLTAKKRINDVHLALDGQRGYNATDKKVHNFAPSAYEFKDGNLIAHFWIMIRKEKKIRLNYSKVRTIPGVVDVDTSNEIHNDTVYIHFRLEG